MRDSLASEPFGLVVLAARSVHERRDLPPVGLCDRVVCVCEFAALHGEALGILVAPEFA